MSRWPEAGLLCVFSGIVAGMIFAVHPCVPSALAASLGAQDSAPSDSSQSAPSPKQDASDAVNQAKKTKKVWTNEDLGNASSTASHAVNTSEKPKPKTTTPTAADAQYIANFKKQMQKLQMDLEDTDKQISDLDRFQKGELPGGTEGMKLRKAYSTEPIDAQIRKLQEKKKQIQAKMDAMVDDARKRGLLPGQLR